GRRIRRRRAGIDGPGCASARLHPRAGVMTALAAAVLAGLAVAIFAGSPRSLLRRRLGIERSHGWSQPRRPVLAATGVLAFLVGLIRFGDRPHVIVMGMSCCGIAYAAVVLRRRGTS